MKCYLCSRSLENLSVKFVRNIPGESQWFCSFKCLACLETEHDDNSPVDHPPHYGGVDNPYEAIKVIEAWGCGFHLGNALKYICRAGKKEGVTAKEDVEKALWYLRRFKEIQK